MTSMDAAKTPDVAGNHSHIQPSRVGDSGTVIMCCALPGEKNCSINLFELDVEDLMCVL